MAERRFVVEGPQAVREALPDLLELFVDPDGAERHAELVAAAACPVTPVSPSDSAVSPCGYCSGITPMPIRLERWMRS